MATGAPRLIIKERDVSDIIQPAGTTVGAVVGKTNKGPINVRVPITSDKEFIGKFGKPEAITDYAHYGALEFLKESSQLVFVRPSFGDEYYANRYISIATSAVEISSSDSISAVTTTDLLAVALYADGNTLTSQNGEPGIYDIEFAPTLSAHGTSLIVASIGPGAYGNDIGISVVTCANDTLTNVENGFNWQYSFDDTDLNGNPKATSATDVIWPYVYRLNVYTKPEGRDDTYWGDTTIAAISSTAPDESYLVSNYKLKDATGASLYAPDVINGSSSYIYVNVTDSSYPTPQTTIVSLTNGTDGTTSTAAQKQQAWTLFADKEKVDVNIMLVPDEPNTNDITTIKNVAAIAAKRQDAIAVGQVGTRSDLTTTQLLTKLNTYSIVEPSYAALYSGWDQIFDSFLDQKIYIPKAIYGAALMARNDRLANPWNAPAGINRGILPSIGQLKIYNEAEMGVLYDNNINTSKFIRGQGNVMWGQKTAQRKKSALDRINVRRLLIYVESSLEPTLLNFLFEQNTDKTRSRVSSIINSFMETVQSGGGVTSYQVVCDASNNTAQVIDNNELLVDLVLAPSKTIEYIKLVVTITSTGINFTEVL